MPAVCMRAAMVRGAMHVFAAMLVVMMTMEAVRVVAVPVVPAGRRRRHMATMPVRTYIQVPTGGAPYGQIERYSGFCFAAKHQQNCP